MSLIKSIIKYINKSYKYPFFTIFIIISLVSFIYTVTTALHDKTIHANIENVKFIVVTSMIVGLFIIASMIFTSNRDLNDFDVRNIISHQPKMKVNLDHLKENLEKLARNRPPMARTDTKPLPSSYFEHLANESSLISERMHTRASIYLFVGVFISFVGIILYYFSKLEFVTSEEPETLDIILAHASRVGALFFIEFVAFFFLKQYRNLMTEYRYYERIKRHRQNNVSIIKLISDHGETTDKVRSILENIKFPHDETIFKNGETSSSIEQQKSIDKDLDFLDKIKDIITAARGDSKE